MHFRCALVAFVFTVISSFANADVVDTSQARPPTDDEWAAIKPVLEDNIAREKLGIVRANLHAGNGPANDFIVAVKDSSWCGSGGCAFWIYLADDKGGLRQVADMQGGKLNTSPLSHRGMVDIIVEGREGLKTSIWNATEQKYPQPAKIDDIKAWVAWVPKLQDLVGYEGADRQIWMNQTQAIYAKDSITPDDFASLSKNYDSYKSRCAQIDLNSEAFKPLQAFNEYIQADFAKIFSRYKDACMRHLNIMEDSLKTLSPQGLQITGLSPAPTLDAVYRAHKADVYALKDDLDEAAKSLKMAIDHVGGDSDLTNIRKESGATP